MGKIDADILNEFLTEAKRLVAECQTLLEDVDGKPGEALRLEEFANKIDRVMGAAKSLGLLVDGDHPLHMVGDTTAICKALGYRGAKVGNQPQLYGVTVSFLLDAVETVDEILDRMEDPAADLRADLKNTLLERLKWISDIYRKIPEAQASSGEKLVQNEIDELMKKLGMD